MKRRRNTLAQPDMGTVYGAVEPVLGEMERFRRGHLLFLLVIVPLISVPAGIFSGMYALGLFKSAMSGYVACAVCGMLVATTIYRIFDRDYRRRCKRRFNRKFAKLMDMRYEPMGTFNIGALHPHYILPAFARGLTEDSLTFIHNGRKIEMQEVIFTPSVAMDVHMFNPKTFAGKRGLIIKIPSRRTFDVHTVVVPKRFVASDRNRARFMGLRNYERAPFGNRRFSEKYYVMSMASDEAHLVFDPAFIERVLAFEKAVGARSLSFSFLDRQILVYADHAHDFLEAGHLLEPISFAHADKIISELQALTRLIDTLELNQFVGV
ncbi:MAG: DUF3137 domain-containing protein [Alphaproteobacteria bacterium]|nr:DUF3137 domain-containing protein [Alphaproteobacteria bacterium]